MLQLSFSTALHNFFEIGTAQKALHERYPESLAQVCRSRFFPLLFLHSQVCITKYLCTNTRCQKQGSKDFQKSEKGRKVDQCRTTFNDSSFGLHPQSSKYQTQQMLHCLLSAVETHLASQPDLLKQDHGPYCVIAFYANHLPPSKFQWQWEGSSALKLITGYGLWGSA